MVTRFGQKLAHAPNIKTNGHLGLITAFQLNYHCTNSSDGAACLIYTIYMFTSIPVALRTFPKYVKVSSDTSNPKIPKIVQR